jgi:hypothetical protein
VQRPGAPAVQRPLAGLVFDQLELLGDPFAAGLVVGVEVVVADDPSARRAMAQYQPMSSTERSSCSIA